MNPILLFEFSIGFLILGALFSSILAHKRTLVGNFSLVTMILAAIGIFVVVVQVFQNGPVQMDEPLWVVPGLGASLSLKIDYLSALFLAIIAMVSVLVVLYANPFLKIKEFNKYTLCSFYPILFIFFAGVMCVVAVADMFFFFVFWEIMTLASYVLVVFKNDDSARLRAGFKYFLITHISTAFMFIGAILLYLQVESFSFEGMKNAMAIMSIEKPALLHLILLFFFMGFATKAGILPMGDWLPDAYPAAPAPASAAFAGSMTKLGIYGLIRIFIDILPVSGYTETWGIVIALFGTASIFVGTLTALVQEDSKRLLSFHVIGQMGYMFLGIGTGVYFLKSHPLFAIIGIGAGVFHLVNHVCYKSCLFFNAGSVLFKTGTRNLNDVGGLSRLMPLTAATTVIASLAIAGIPPFSGFSSKWLIYQASIQAGTYNPLLIALGIIAIFISAVTLASFVKFFSSVFYGKFADNNSNAGKGDVPTGMMIPQITLAGLIVFFGLYPLLPLRFIYTAVSNLLEKGVAPTFASAFGSSPFGGLALSDGNTIIAQWNPSLMVGLGIICFVISYVIYKSGGATTRADETWYCGEKYTDEQVRYRAHGFYLPFKNLFRLRIGRYETKGVYPIIRYKLPRLNENNALKKMTNIDHWFYYPLVSGFLKLMRWFSSIHTGVPHFYLLWLVIGTILAILVMFLISGTSGHF